VNSLKKSVGRWALKQMDETVSRTARNAYKFNPDEAHGILSAVTRNLNLVQQALFTHIRVCLGADDADAVLRAYYTANQSFSDLADIKLLRILLKHRELVWKIQRRVGYSNAFHAVLFKEALMKGLDSEGKDLAFLNLVLGLPKGRGARYFERAVQVYESRRSLYFMMRDAFCCSTERQRRTINPATNLQWGGW
jgi:hypothetical protein